MKRCRHGLRVSLKMGGVLINTLQGGTIEVTFSTMSPDVMVNGVNIASFDIDASNGVIHVIDAVLLP